MGGAHGLGARVVAGAILDGEEGIALVVAVVASAAHWD